MQTNHNAQISWTKRKFIDTHYLKVFFLMNLFIFILNMHAISK